jgi:RND family efflux transporter MFP subunit
LAEYVVDTATVRIPLLLPAQLYVEHDAVVVSRTAGTVDSIFVELGDEVKAGQKLARLESAEQEIALASAEADFDNIELIADRARVLRKSGSITTADSQQAEFQLRQAAIALQKAKRDLELTSVTAPFHGVVSARAVRPRRYVAPGDTLFRVSEVEPLFARIRVPEASVNLVRTGETAVIIGSGGESTTATIIHAAPILDAGSGTREVVLKVARQRGSLRTGANVTVRVGSDRRRVVVVAREAIAPEGYALVLNDGRSTMRAVVLGSLLDKGRVEVVSGLSPGERLVRPKP